MIVSNQRISYKNVVSKFYAGLAEDMNEAFLDFQKLVKKRNWSPTAPMFFSILSDVTQNEMLIQIHLPIEETLMEKDKGNDNIQFRSYFYLSNLIMTKVTENLEINTLNAYGDLLNYIAENNLEIEKPFFNIPKELHGNSYVEIYLGINNKIKSPAETVKQFSETEFNSLYWM